MQPEIGEASCQKLRARNSSWPFRVPQIPWASRMSRRSSARIARALTRFANNTIHQNVAEQDRWISVRASAGSSNRACYHQPLRSGLDSRRRRAGSRAGPFRGARSGFVAALRAFGDFGNQALRRGHRERHAPASRKHVAEAIRVIESAGQRPPEFTPPDRASKLCIIRAAWRPGTPRPWRSFQSPPWRAIVRMGQSFSRVPCVHRSSSAGPQRR